MAYRTGPYRNVSVPHAHATKFLAGGNGDDAGANQGWNIMAWKNLPDISGYPAYIYASWYERIDPLWQFGVGSPVDYNFKNTVYSPGSAEYFGITYWYSEFRGNGDFSSGSAPANFHVIDDAHGGAEASLEDPTSDWYFDLRSGDLTAQWVKYQHEYKLSNSVDGGYIKIWQDGVQKANYVTKTDSYNGVTRTFGMGGYTRDRDPDNFRYFADCYVDWTPQRVVLANNATLASATVVENQIPSAWADGSITLKVNLGAFADTGTAYLFVHDSIGAANSSGFPITLGEGGGGQVATALRPAMMM